jgi:hypothetical protein
MKRIAVLLFCFAVISCGSPKEETEANKNAIKWISENLPQSTLLDCTWAATSYYNCSIIHKNKLHTIACSSNPDTNATCWASDNVINLIDHLSPAEK